MRRQTVSLLSFRPNPFDPFDTYPHLINLILGAFLLQLQALLAELALPVQLLCETSSLRPRGDLLFFAFRDFPTHLLQLGLEGFSHRATPETVETHGRLKRMEHEEHAWSATTGGCESSNWMSLSGKVDILFCSTLS